MKRQSIFSVLLATGVSLGGMTLVGSCSAEKDLQDDQLRPLNLCSLGSSEKELDGPAGAKVFTRYTDADKFKPSAGGVDQSKLPFYLEYSDLYPVPINKDYTTIGAFLAEDRLPVYDKLAGYFRYKEGNTWLTTVGVKPLDYYIFGYMPSNINSIEAKIEKRSSTWADGAVMTIKNLSTVTPADVCVVVGVLKGADSSTSIKDVASQLQQGVYAYEGTETGNYVYLLLDHIYANVNLELCLDPEYAQLRTVVLKKVSMKSDVKETVDVVVTITDDPIDPIQSIDYTQSSDPPVDATLFPEEGQYATPISSDPAHPTSVPGYFAPGLTTQSFDFEFLYDVYDKKNIDAEHPYGNLVREDCRVINKWSLSNDAVMAGKSFKVTATIKPTYLYMLSEPDLDNPTIVFE